MSEISRLEIGLLILVVAVVLIPIGIVILAGSHSAYYTVSGEPVKDILEKKGVNVTNVTDTHWDVPGALGGKTYVLTDADNQQTIITTQNFDSEESRDAAIRTWHTSQAGRGKPAGNLIIIGQHVIVVSQPNRPVMDVIGPDLINNLKK